MRRIKLEVAYDGTDYHGWQVQPGLPTIQGLLEAAFFDIEKQHVHVAGSGRTDAGVHAAAQVAAVTIANPIPASNLKKALNRVLPPDVRIVSVEETASSFHPRFDATSKTYEYRIVRSEVCSPFERRYVHHHPYPMDDDRFLSSAPIFEGEFDFSAFAAADDRDEEGHSKVRRIFRSRAGSGEGKLSLSITGSGFLKHMVRNIAGTLIEVAKGNLTEEGLRRLLTAPERKAGPRAPASGLFLMEVRYDGQTANDCGSSIAGTRVR
jgi:tRNA pseudouridine38-40 synthase